MTKNPPPSLNQILFLDIETVRQSRTLYNGEVATGAPLAVSDFFHKRYRHKMDANATVADWEQLWLDTAPMTAEYGRIFNISVGTFRVKTDGTPRFYVKSLCSRDEKKVLKAFCDIVEDTEPAPSVMCAHNGVDFDFMFIFRRCVAHGIKPPALLDPYWKKPWELTDVLLDTLRLWQGTQFNHRASLDNICYLLGIPSPKGDMDGSMVGDLYWQFGDDLPFDNPANPKELELLERVGKYGAGDVVALVRVFCKLTGHNYITDEQIQYLKWE